MKHSTATRDLDLENRANHDPRLQEALAEREAQIVKNVESLLTEYCFGRQDRGNFVAYPLVEVKTGDKLGLVVRDRNTDRTEVFWNETTYRDLVLMRALEVSRRTGRGRAS